VTAALRNKAGDLEPRRKWAWFPIACKIVATWTEHASSMKKEEVR